MRRALLPVVLAALLLAPGASAWTWPAGGPVLQPFLFDPSHPYAAGQHRGIDLGGAEGSPVLAPAAGTVSFAGTVPSSGKSVTIETPDGYSVTLTHLGSISVARNAEVAEGGPVGTIGASGDGEVPQPYVHLGVRLTEQVQGYLDPLTLLPPHGAAPAEPAPVPIPAPVSSSAPVPVPAPPPVPAAAAATPSPEPAASSAPTPAPATVSPRATVVAASAGAHTAPVQAHQAPLEVDAAPALEGTAATGTVRRPAARQGAVQPGAAGLALTSATNVTRPAERSRLRVRPAASSSTIASRARYPGSGTGAPLSVARPRGVRLSSSQIVASAHVSRVGARRTRPPAQPSFAPDPGTPRAAAAARQSGATPVSSPAGFLLALPLVLGVMGLAASRRKGAPIIVPDALLRDHADLLRERQAPHWPRVHHDRGRHPGAASSSARRRDVLPHRRSNT